MVSGVTMCSITDYEQKIFALVMFLSHMHVNKHFLTNSPICVDSIQLGSRVALFPGYTFSCVCWNMKNRFVELEK